MMQQMRTPIEAQAVAAAVSEQFAFLIPAGYNVVSAEPDRAVLSNGNISLEFEIEPGSFAVMSEIGRAATGERHTLYAALADVVPMAANAVTCSGRDLESFVRCLQKLSELCREYLLPVLLGDEDAFKRMADTASKLENKYTIKFQYGAVVDRANRAWEDKDWDKALELYESAKPALSKTEHKRLNYLLSKRFNK